MLPRDLRYSRRKFLASAAAATLGSGLAHRPAGASIAPPPRTGRAPIAVLATVYRPLSYAYHLVGRFLHGYPRGGEQHVPAQYVHSLWVEQTPENDLSRDLARAFDFRRARTVRDALLDENGRLAVDGVLIIAEHGNYPRNEQGQILYPRAELFGQVTDVFSQTGRSVPVFCAKHLSYSWEKATRMVAAAGELGFPLLAGSTLPTTWRRPELELPTRDAVEESLVAAYGPVEVAGFDALDALQCMVERRRDGETGVRAVTCLSGPAVWQAADAGRWDWSLLHEALARGESVNLGDVRQNCGRVALPNMPATPPTSFLIEYADGTRGTVLLLNGHLQDFVFAGRVRGTAESCACLFHLPPAPGAKHFDGQAAAIERLIADRRSPQPIERTLLTTGMLDSLMESHHRRGDRIETPHLAVRYEPPVESTFLRESVV
jgi:hypothetical protein